MPPINLAWAPKCLIQHCVQGNFPRGKCPGRMECPEGNMSRVNVLDLRRILTRAIHVEGTRSQGRQNTKMCPICTKLVAGRIFDFLSMTLYLKEKDVLFTMTHKLSFYLNPN